jgi:hypothetical protein
LLTRILSLASPVQKDQVIQTVGDVIRPGQLVSSDDWTVTLPNGDIQSAADLVENDTAADNAAITLAEPGRYTVTGKTEDGEYSVSLIAGLAAIESRTEMLPVGQLQVLGIGVDSPVEGQLDDVAATDVAKAGQLNASALEKKQKWWRWLLLAGLGCLLLESLWASAIERRSAAT